MVRANTKEKMQTIALERMYRLFALAKKEFNKNPARSNRYVKLARSIGMKYNVRFTKDLKMQFCKKCSTFWMQGKNVSVRTSASHKSVEYTCAKCKTVRRFGYSKEKK